MRIVRSASPVVALCVSDLHIGLKAPVCRAGEADWLEAMGRSFSQLLQHQLDVSPSSDDLVPVLVAGDVFDRWNAPAEVINWAIQNLPPFVFAVPGNHDLPAHRPELVHRSAYGTLVHAGAIKNMLTRPRGLHYDANLILYATTFNGEPPKVDRSGDRALAVHVLVTHQYLWANDKHKHEGAPENCRLSNVVEQFADYDVVVVGDNHVPFDRSFHDGIHVINCGTFLRRKTTEAEHRPRIGRIHADGSVTSHFLDVRHDVIDRGVSAEQEQVDDVSAEIDDLIAGLLTLQKSSLDYRENVMRAMKFRGVRQEVRDALLKAMETKD